MKNGFQVERLLPLNQAANRVYKNHVRGKFTKSDKTHSDSKFNKTDTDRIKFKYYRNNMSVKDIAGLYNVSPSLIRSIIKHDSYKKMIAPFEEVVYKSGKWQFNINLLELYKFIV